MGATSADAEREPTLPPPLARSLPGALDDVGVRYGSELSSLDRNVLTAWERFLEPLRDEAIDILDIGVGAGASLRTWRDWFPRARLFGLEARRVVLDPPVADSRVFHGNQADLDTLQRILREGRFRLVIDDGSRHGEDQIFTFTTVFPWLEAGSVYICAGIPHPVSGPHADADPRAADWFAGLGRALAGGWEGPAGDVDVVRLIRRKAAGVFLMRGSAIVVSDEHGVGV